MSAIMLGDCSGIWGVVEPKPLKGFPEGRVKLRLRNKDFARAFVKTSNGIRSFIIAEQDGFWIPKWEQGSNHREVTP